MKGDLRGHRRTQRRIGAALALLATALGAGARAAAGGTASDQWRLVSSFVVRNRNLQPKSIAASGTGLFFAQNMMYRHNVMATSPTR